MEHLLSKCKKKIDIHKPSIDILQNGAVMTPIYSYFRRCGDKMKLEEDRLILDNEHINSYFGTQPLSFELNIEYFEFFTLFFTPGL